MIEHGKICARKKRLQFTMTVIDNRNNNKFLIVLRTTQRIVQNDDNIRTFYLNRIFVLALTLFSKTVCFS